MLKLRSMLSSVYRSIPTLLSWLYSLGTKAKTNISALLLFLFFSLFIVYIFYNRLIRERLPRDLSEPVSSLQEYIYMYILGVNIIILILLLWGRYQEYIDEAYEELGIERKVNKESIWYRFQDKLNSYTFEARVQISQTYMGIIYPRWKDVYHRFLIECYIQFNKLSDGVKVYYFYTMLIVPKLVVAGVFLWDVIIQNELNLFYRVLGLLLIPLLFRFITYNYLVIVYSGIDHINNDLNNDPHVFRGTDEDLVQVLANLTEKDFSQARSRTNEFIKQQNTVWYKRVFSSLKEFLSNLQQKNGIALYGYNLRICSLLGNLPQLMEKLDSMSKSVRLALNVILRFCYIIAWALIIYKTQRC